MSLTIITNRKSHTIFRLVPTSVTLNDLERRNSPYFTEFDSFTSLLRHSGWRETYIVCRISSSTFGQSWRTLQRGLSAIAELLVNTHKTNTENTRLYSTGARVLFPCNFMYFCLSFFIYLCFVYRISWRRLTEGWCAKAYIGMDIYRIKYVFLSSLRIVH